MRKNRAVIPALLIIGGLLLLLITVQMMGSHWF